MKILIPLVVLVAVAAASRERRGVLYKPGLLTSHHADPYLSGAPISHLSHHSHYSPLLTSHHALSHHEPLHLNYAQSAPILHSGYSPLNSYSHSPIHSSSLHHAALINSDLLHARPLSHRHHTILNTCHGCSPIGSAPLLSSHSLLHHDPLLDSHHSLDHHSPLLNSHIGHAPILSSYHSDLSHAPLLHSHGSLSHSSLGAPRIIKVVKASPAIHSSSRYASGWW